MPGQKRVRSLVAPSKRAAVATAPNAVVAAPREGQPRIGIVDLRIAMLPHAPAPSAAHWRSFAASIAGVESRGHVAPTIWVDPDLRGATVRVAGWDTVAAIQMVRLFATNSPSPPLWQSHSYEIAVIHYEDLPLTGPVHRPAANVKK
jgi:hypothetical protein